MYPVNKLRHLNTLEFLRFLKDGRNTCLKLYALTYFPIFGLQTFVRFRFLEASIIAPITPHSSTRAAIMIKIVFIFIFFYFVKLHIMSINSQEIHSLKFNLKTNMKTKKNNRP